MSADAPTAAARRKTSHKRVQRDMEACPMTDDDDRDLRILRGLLLGMLAGAATWAWLGLLLWWVIGR